MDDTPLRLPIPYLKTGKLSKETCHQLAFKLSNNWIPNNVRSGGSRKKKKKRTKDFAVGRELGLVYG